MGDKIAIDIALLPSNPIMEEAMRINKQFKSRFTLNKNNYLPHITLAQAILKKTDLPRAKTIIQKTAYLFKPIKMRAFIVNEPSAMFEITRTKELDSLHNMVMTEFKDLVSYDVDEKFFYDNHVRAKSLDYVRNFLSVAYDNYYPHLTLGPEQVDTQLKLDFTCNRLVICHLGDYNTCRKILFETTLNLREK